MTNKERSVKFFETVWNDRNEDALTGFMHPDASANLEGGVYCRGLEEFRAWRKQILEAMPDLHFEIIDAIEEGPNVVVRWSATVTIGGEQHRVNGMTWMLHRGDKIVEGIDAWNKGELDAKIAAARAAVA